jgi:hypothetical protein
MPDHVAVLSVHAFVASRADNGAKFVSDPNTDEKCRFRSAERIGVPAGIIDVSNFTRPRFSFPLASFPTIIVGLDPYTVDGLSCEIIVSCAAAGSGTTVIVGSITTGNTRSFAVSQARSGSTVTTDRPPCWVTVCVTRSE